jgi:hypothetical protein
MARVPNDRDPLVRRPFGHVPPHRLPPADQGPPQQGPPQQGPPQQGPPQQGSRQQGPQQGPPLAGRPPPGPPYQRPPHQPPPPVRPGRPTLSMPPPGRPPRRRRRPAWIAAVLAVVAVLELAAGVVALGRLHSGGGTVALPGSTLAGPRAAPAPVPNGSDPGAGREAAVRSLLDRRSTAMSSRDRTGWLSVIDPAATAFRAEQAALFDNLAQVPLTSWRYVLDGPGSRALTAAAARAYQPAAVWVPPVQLEYGLRGVDSSPTQRPQVLTFVQRGQTWYLAADTDPVADGTHTWRGVWDFGPVRVRRGGSSLVLAHPRNADRLDTFAAGADAAVPRVNSVWGNKWSRQVAVLIPDDNAELVALVGPQFASSRIAAVSIADFADVSSARALGQRIVVNPANLDRLGASGRQIVLTHEITHIASRAATGDRMPTWLVEGFADFVGYRDSGLPVSVIGQEVAQAVRARGWPGRLPADADFRGDSPRLSLAYEEGWFACRLIAARIGLPGLVAFYREVGANAGGGPGAVDAALRRSLHLSTAQFVQQWRQAVRSELG